MAKYLILGPLQWEIMTVLSVPRWKKSLEDGAFLSPHTTYLFGDQKCSGRRPRPLFAPSSGGEELRCGGGAAAIGVHSGNHPSQRGRTSIMTAIRTWGGEEGRE